MISYLIQWIGTYYHDIYFDAQIASVGVPPDGFPSSLHTFSSLFEQFLVAQ